MKTGSVVVYLFVTDTISVSGGPRRSHIKDHWSLISFGLKTLNDNNTGATEIKTAKAAPSVKIMQLHF